MKNKNFSNKKLNKKETFYLCYSQSYLNAAELLTERTLKEKIAKENPFCCLSLPAIFCLRHSMELFLKFLCYCFAPKIKIDNIKHHDIKILMKQVIKALEIIENKNFKLFANNLNTDKKIIKNIYRQKIIKLNDLINKYYCHSYMGNKILEDKKNELMRYPNNLSVVNSLVKKNFDTNNIKKDIEEFNLFIQLFFFLFLTPSHRSRHSTGTDRRKSNI